VARIDLRHEANVAGDWFVDTRCIDCGTCRDIAPDVFGAVGWTSVVVAQPGADESATRDAWLAAQACPTSSIGTVSRQPRPGRLYPREIEAGSGVFDCGYCSEDSFGASAWFVRRPMGNLLIDSPRYTEALAAPILAAGGIDHILLTHRDDVADARRWADRFGARVWIHADDAGAAPFATDRFVGVEQVVIEPGVVAIPTPGHTRGSAVFLVDGRYLFTGDSLAWSHDRQDLTAFRDACWWSWPAQADSLARLAADHRFAWVLPGHGARVHDDPEILHERLDRLVERMRAPR
jgi:glyoxylase-like metal-dependent hydrolase (beta-lactamase superfamily II)/ferredoxin